MFLQTNDRLINLKNVSNINILDNSNRIIFNMNYNIEMQGKDGTKFISDYVYWDAISYDDFLQNIDHLQANPYFEDNFINQYNEEGYINKHEISSIKFSEKKNRVIFNLSHPITFRDYNGDSKITSEFVYVNCHNNDEYAEYVEYVKTSINI